MKKLIVLFTLTAFTGMFIGCGEQPSAPKKEETKKEEPKKEEKK